MRDGYCDGAKLLSLLRWQRTKALMGWLTKDSRRRRDPYCAQAHWKFLPLFDLLTKKKRFDTMRIQVKHKNMRFLRTPFIIGTYFLKQNIHVDQISN